MRNIYKAPGLSGILATGILLASVFVPGCCTPSNREGYELMREDIERATYMIRSVVNDVEEMSAEMDELRQRIEGLERR